MSIAIHFIDGLSCPFFVCEVCGNRITDVAQAMAAWGEVLGGTRNGDPVTPAHVHKGACLDIFEKRLAKGQRLMTEELATHLEFLADNSNSEAEDEH